MCRHNGVPGTDSDDDKLLGVFQQEVRLRLQARRQRRRQTTQHRGASPAATGLGRSGRGDRLEPSGRPAPRGGEASTTGAAPNLVFKQHTFGGRYNRRCPHCVTFPYNAGGAWNPRLANLDTTSGQELKIFKCIMEECHFHVCFKDAQGLFAQVSVIDGNQLLDGKDGKVTLRTHQKSQKQGKNLKNFRYAGCLTDKVRSGDVEFVLSPVATAPPASEEPPHPDPRARAPANDATAAHSTNACGVHVGFMASAQLVQPAGVQRVDLSGVDDQLTDVQRAGVEWLVSRRNGGVIMERCGAGKSKQALAVIRLCKMGRLQVNGAGTIAAVVAPIAAVVAPSQTLPQWLSYVACVEHHEMSGHLTVGIYRDGRISGVCRWLHPTQLLPSNQHGGTCVRCLSPIGEDSTGWSCGQCGQPGSYAESKSGSNVAAMSEILLCGRCACVSTTRPDVVLCSTETAQRGGFWKQWEGGCPLKVVVLDEIHLMGDTLGTAMREFRSRHRSAWVVGLSGTLQEADTATLWRAVSMVAGYGDRTLAGVTELLDTGRDVTSTLRSLMGYFMRYREVSLESIGIRPPKVTNVVIPQTISDCTASGWKLRSAHNGLKPGGSLAALLLPRGQSADAAHTTRSASPGAETADDKWAGFATKHLQDQDSHVDWSGGVEGECSRDRDHAEMAAAILHKHVQSLRSAGTTVSVASVCGERNLKLRYLVKQISGYDAGAKVLVFARRTAVLALLYAVLRGLRVDAVLLWGQEASGRSHPTHTARIREFSSKKGKAVALIQPLACGVGVSIPAATHAILFDVLSHCQTQQAVGRAVRRHQRNCVEVTQYVVDGPDSEALESQGTKAQERRDMLLRICSGPAVDFPAVTTSASVRTRPRDCKPDRGVDPALAALRDWEACDEPLPSLGLYPC